MVFLTIVIFILVFGLIVFVHEFGHFLVAKKTGVAVDEFAFGFPPKIFSWKRGETVYAVNLLPLGGYVKLRGEDGGEKGPRSFMGKKARTKSAILLAGIVMNFLLAWVLLTVIIILPQQYRGNGAVFVSGVLSGTSAEKAGVKVGDAIVQINETLITDGSELKKITESNQSKTVSLKIRRNGTEHTKDVILGTGDAPLGIATSTFSLADIKISPWRAPIEAGAEIGRVFWGYCLFIGGIFGIGSTIVTADQISGPVGIYSVVAQFVALGWVYILFVTAQLSLAIAFFNLLPLPALDGGRFFFVVLKKILRGKYISLKVEQITHTVGFLVLMGLFVVIAYRDILKLIK